MPGAHHKWDQVVQQSGKHYLLCHRTRAQSGIWLNTASCI